MVFLSQVAPCYFLCVFNEQNKKGNFICASRLLPAEGAALSQTGLATGGLAQDGGAAGADDDGLGVREDGGDGEATGALDVHEEGAGLGHKGLDEEGPSAFPIRIVRFHFAYIHISISIIPFSSSKLWWLRYVEGCCCGGTQVSCPPSTLLGPHPHPPQLRDRFSIFPSDIRSSAYLKLVLAGLSLRRGVEEIERENLGDDSSAKEFFIDLSC